MKVKVTNTSKVPVERLGRSFTKDKPVELEVTNREYLALRAVKALAVELVTEPAKPDAKKGGRSEKTDPGGKE